MSSDDEPVLVLKAPHPPWLTFFAAMSGLSITVGFVLALMPIAHFLLWLALGFAGIVGLALVSCLLPSSALILTPDGFAVRVASRMAFYPWRDIDYFAVAERRLVAFRLFDSSDKVSPVVRQLTGFDGALPAQYGSLPAELLALRLNECCRRFASKD
ncbi:MAG TPA: hypothetical protein VG826_00865 [Pirellulales bacterium]|nr:hypothetical protein [Pirellulales bacterium]